MNRCFAVALVLVSVFPLSGRVQAAEEIVQLRMQRARCICGIVSYVTGDVVSGALVEDFAEDWRGTPLRSIKANSEGRFVLTPVKGRKVYYLQISSRKPGVNPLRIPVQISRIRGTKLLRLRLHLA